MGFCSLQHMRNRRSTCRGLYLPATFRLQGLVTLLTVSSLRSPADFFSRRQRSWDSPFGAFSSGKVPLTSQSGWTHLPFRLGGGTETLSSGRPPRPRFLGRDPFRSPWQPSVCLARRLAGCSLGFCLLGFEDDGLGRDSARPPLSRFIGRAAPRGNGHCRSASQSIDRPPPCPARFSTRERTEASRATLVGFPHPLRPEHSGLSEFWLCVHRSPRRTLLPPARRPSNSRLHPTAVVRTA